MPKSEKHCHQHTLYGTFSAQAQHAPHSSTLSLIIPIGPILEPLRLLGLAIRIGEEPRLAVINNGMDAGNGPRRKMIPLRPLKAPDQVP